MDIQTEGQLIEVAIPRFALTLRLVRSRNAETARATSKGYFSEQRKYEFLYRPYR